MDDNTQKISSSTRYSLSYGRNRTLARIRNSMLSLDVIRKNRTMAVNRLQLNDKNMEGQTKQPESPDTEEIQSAVNHLQLFEKKYEILEKIGEGSSGVVYRCRKRRNGKEYAAKSFQF